MNRLSLAILIALAAAPISALAQSAPPQADSTEARKEKPVQPTSSPYEWAPIQVIGQRLFPYQEGMQFNQGYIEEQPKGNGDIATLLRINPAVQFDDTAFTSRNMGEIRPADISINGSLYYQNTYLVDGASFNSDLDPASNNPNHFADPPSHTQGIALDTSLIGSLTVYDSNVPASFGGFNGGVIDAQTRDAKDTLSGKLTYRMSRSVWNEYHINPGYAETFEQSSTAANQPIYDKYQASLLLEGRTASGIGLIGTFSRTHSVIPLYAHSGGRIPENDTPIKDTTRQNTSASLRANWSNDSGLSLSASVIYAPTDETYFIQNARNSWFDLKQGGPIVSLRATLARNAWKVDNTLSYSDLDSSRRSEVDYWRTWRYSDDKNWGTGTGTSINSTEGTWGNVDQTSQNLSYKLVAERDGFQAGNTEHRLQFGFEVASRKASYHRLNDHFSWITPVRTTTCTDANGVVDTVACSLSPALGFNGQGQYLSRLTTYHAGYFEAQSTDWAVFVQDDIRAGNWSFRPGLRIDGSSLTRDANVAPRFSTSWDIGGKQTSILTAGLNRYFGRNLFAYKLREGRERLETVQTRVATGANALVWSAPVQSTTQTRFEELDVPYSDELSLGFNQVWGNFDFNGKYVKRRNRDEIMRLRVPSGDSSGYYATNVYEYVNVGRAESDIYTLSVGMRRPWQWGPASTSAQFAFDYTDVRRSYTGAYQDYSTTFDEEAYNATVRYQGTLMLYRDIPADSFNRPWTARLATQTRIDDWGLLWSNFLRYRAGYLGITRTGYEDLNGERIGVYNNYDYPDSFTWDSVFEYTLKLTDSQQAYARVEVQNVLNKANLISGTSTAAYYEPGRSYWLELGYRF